MRARIILLLSFLLLAAITPTAHAADERCFPETTYCISGPIRAYWERNGGLAVFGYPIGSQQVETNNDGWTGPTQWFERDRLEDHGAEGVMAGRLGAYYLELQGRPWARGNEAPRPGYETCTLNDVTGYNLCPPFSAYWRMNGGLERFGHPISPAIFEMVEGKTYLVQYFERRRMEYHPENAGTQYEVLLGLLGRDINRSLPCAPSTDEVMQRVMRGYLRDLGCPSTAGTRDFAPIVVQQFEHGAMLWTPSATNEPPVIYVLSAVPGEQRSTWQAFPDTFNQNPEAGGGGETPPAGRFAPVRGFGKIWWNNQAVRDAIGWGITPETNETGSVALFDHGGRIVTWPAQQLAYVLLPNGDAQLFFKSR